MAVLIGPQAARQLLLPVLMVGAVAGVISGAVNPGAKTPRGRLCAVGWNLALVAVSLIVLNTLLVRRDGWTSPWALLVMPAAAATLLILRPRLAKAGIACGLIALGFYGFVTVRQASFGFWDGYYGATTAGQADLTFYLLLPQAYLFLVVGSWLGWRSADRTSAWLRRLLGRLAEPGRPSRPWGLLLLPVAVMAGALVIPNLWFGPGVAGLILPVLIITAAVLFVRAAPERAAATAVAGLIGLGLAGVYLAATYATGGWRLPVNAAGYIEYGLVDVTSRTMAGVALIQGLAFIGAGICLVPRAAPGVLRHLGVLGNRDLARRIQRLTESRAVAVDTAAADLRRLERDLHDGAQARLVALGMHLRAVEKLIPTSPDAALALVAEARETSARALTELRELVRGVHPPVLADRGLGDAVRALTLNSPLQVETEIALPGRLPAPIETACYFAVAELMANAAKHSGAQSARVTAEHDAGVLRICVTDFGVGGADPAAGTGLAGIERRLAAFDGILAVSSPAGGPTMVVIEVPCVLAQPAARAR